MKRNLFLAALMITYMSVAQLLVSPEGSYVGGTENGGSSWSNQPKYKMKGYLQNGGNSVQFNFRKNQDYLQGSETTLFTEPGTVYLRKGSVNGPILAQEVVHTNTYYKKISLYQNQLSGFPFDVYAVYYPTNTTGHGWVGPISIDQVNQLNAPNLSISQNNNHNIVLNWSSVNGAQDYILERSLSPNSGFTPIYTGSGSSFVNNFYVANGEHYYYRVQACDNNSICGEYSNVVDIINHPAPPVISAEINSDGHIELDWNTILQSSNYILERSTSVDTGFTAVYSGSNSDFVSNFNTHEGVRYYFRVKTCFNNTECGEYSNVVDIINHPAPPV
ncbi:MAG: fibronectin type III domain-containing protein, partial [Flavobacteriales bacterium]